MVFYWSCVFIHFNPLPFQKRYLDFWHLYGKSRDLKKELLLQKILYQIKNRILKILRISNVFLYWNESHFIIKLYWWNDNIFTKIYPLVLPPCPKIMWIQFTIFLDDILSCLTEFFTILGLGLLKFSNHILFPRSMI